MEERFGTRLVEKGLITPDDLHKALERQQMQGGKIGYNLMALGLISESDLASAFHFSPKTPTRAEDAGLNFSFIVELVLKHALFMKTFTIEDLSNRTKLAKPIISQCLDRLREDRLIEITQGDASFSFSNYSFRITDTGTTRAVGLMGENRYIGPAPVELGEYRYGVELQTIRGVDISEENMRRTFADIAIGERQLSTMGAAISSGRPIFLYGPPGNGKTTIAEAIGRVFPGEIYVPYSIYVNGEIIVIFDELNHQPVDEPAPTGEEDKRWVRVKRPIIMAGGEMTLKSLDLQFNVESKYYEAPLQMKANNGMFLIDDFGRQMIDPQNLLNRWIVPLDRRVDFLSLHTGMKFEIPFDQLIVFSTNLDPKKLADEAFLRRLPYKLNIDYPTPEQFEEIFRTVCRSNNLEFDPAVFDHLMEKFSDSGIKPIGCHPRDLIDHVIDEAHYRGKTAVITPESLDQAWGNYFVT